MTTARVTIEESSLGEQRWKVMIERPRETLPRTLWRQCATQVEAEKAAKEASAYLRDRGELPPHPAN